VVHRLLDVVDCVQSGIVIVERPNWRGEIDVSEPAKLASRINEIEQVSAFQLSHVAIDRRARSAGLTQISLLPSI
jgi:hypothetical protein